MCRLNMGVDYLEWDEENRFVVYTVPEDLDTFRAHYRRDAIVRNIIERQFKIADEELNVYALTGFGVEHAGEEVGAPGEAVGVIEEPGAV